MKKVLLHTCCAPCSASILPRLKKMGYETILFWHNPNIFPLEEYRKRLEETEKWAEKNNLKLIIEIDSYEKWEKEIKGYEDEKEGGKRCEICFRLRLEKTAQAAKENNVKYFATTLTNSRYKNTEVIHRIAHEIAKKYDLIFINKDWKKDGGEVDSIRISKEEGFYLQKYCGCKFSIRKDFVLEKKVD